MALGSVSQIFFFTDIAKKWDDRKLTGVKNAHVKVFLKLSKVPIEILYHLL